jgi:hypothetical protein
MPGFSLTFLNTKSYKSNSECITYFLLATVGIGKLLLPENVVQKSIHIGPDVDFAVVVGYAARTIFKLKPFGTICSQLE